MFDRAKVKTAVAHEAVESGSRFRSKRKAFGWPLATVAQLTGTSEATISRIESGSLNPRDDLRWVIAGVMQCEVGDIWPHPSRQAIHDLRVPA